MNQSDDPRSCVAAFLPFAFRKTIESYCHHVTETNDFAVLHRDAKLALAHLETLIKLAKWAECPDNTGTHQPDTAWFDTLLQEAERELATHMITHIARSKP